MLNCRSAIFRLLGTFHAFLRYQILEEISLTKGCGAEQECSEHCGNTELVTDEESIGRGVVE